MSGVCLPIDGIVFVKSCDKRCEKISAICVRTLTRESGFHVYHLLHVTPCFSFNALQWMKCSIINGNLLRSPRDTSSVLFSIGLQSGDLAILPGLSKACAGACAKTAHTNFDQQYADWFEAESGPITYWTLHSLCVLIKRKKLSIHEGFGNILIPVLFVCCHKSQNIHTLCHKMHDFTNTLPSIGRHTTHVLDVRKFPIHYRLNDQNR